MPNKNKLSRGETKAKPPIASVIKELREDMGQSQSQFARVLNVTKDAVAQWEGGRREPNRWLEEKLHAICRRAGRHDLAERIYPPRPTTEEVADRMIAAMDEEELRAVDAHLAKSSGKKPVDDAGARVAAEIPPLKEGDPDLLRHYNDAATGLNLLYEAAQEGAEGAREVLMDLADKLTTRGGNWRKMKYLKKKEG